MAVALITVIPLLAAHVLTERSREWTEAGGWRWAMGAAAVSLVLTGYTILAKYPATIVRLHRILKDVANGECPASVALPQHEADIGSIERHLNAILAELRGRLEAMQRERVHLENELSQAMRLHSMGLVAAGIAHEINTPVQFISDNVRFLSGAIADLTRFVDATVSALGSPPSSQVDPAVVARLRQQAATLDLDFIRQEASASIAQSLEGLAQVACIVRAMHDFSHIATRDEATSVDINRVVTSAATVARAEWKHTAEMRLELTPDLPRVQCRQGDVSQVLLNLIINATHAIEEARVSRKPAVKGLIQISTAVDGDMAVIRVADNGCGIPEEHRGRVFEPFFTTKPEGKGSGQGLAIARKLIDERNAGRLSFETATGVGSTFTVRLPLATT